MEEKFIFPSGLKRFAAMIVLKHREMFLLLKRAKAPYAGHYLPVGGKLEPFEDPHAAALRELEEETGLRLPALRYGGALTETSPLEYNWHSYIYWAEIDWIAPPSCPEGTLEWIPFDALETIPTPPTDMQVYAYLRSGKPFAFNAVYDAQLQLCFMTEEIEGKKVF